VLPSDWQVIGRVETGSGVSVDGWDSPPDGITESGGFEHFRA
jgi:hypothetical protein